MGMHKTSRSIWASGWIRAPVHRVDAYKATEVMQADDREETVFSGQWYESNGKLYGLSEGNANNVGTSFNRCSVPVPDPWGLYHQVKRYIRKEKNLRAAVKKNHEK